MRFIRFFLFLMPVTVFCTSVASASTASAHLVSWAAQLYDMARSTEHIERLSESERAIYQHAMEALRLADIEVWTRSPVMLQTLEASQTMEITHSMEIDATTFVRIDWVEDHIGIKVEHEGASPYLFLLDGRVDIVNQEEGSVLLPVLPEDPLVVIDTLSQE